MEERESVEVTFEGLNELDKLSADVKLRNLDYNAKSKQSYANFVIIVYAKEIEYLYGGMSITGTPLSKGVLTIAIKPSEINFDRKLRQLNEVVHAELNAIKKEIRGLIGSGALRVTVEFNDIVDRIMAKLESEE